MKYFKLIITALMVIFIVGCSSEGSVDDTPVDTPIEAIGLAWVSSSNDINITEDSLVSVDLQSGNLTMVQDYSTDINLSGIDFFAGADMVGDNYISIQFMSSKLYSFDVDGSYTVLGDYSSLGFGSQWTGVAYDNLNDKLYMTTGNKLFELDSSYSIISTIDISSGLTIGVACIANGTIYGIDIVNNTLVTIDTSNGQTTVIGSLGIDVNYAQDIAYDRINDKLYGTLYTDNGALYDINISSGEVTIIGNFSEQQVEVAGFAITY